jgi:GNAT superfamily N-acetyltransferase
MHTDNPVLPSGYSPVPPGRVALAVTFLEMNARPPRKAVRPTERPLLVERWEAPAIEEYRTLFRAVGEDWMWFSRLAMPDEELHDLLGDGGVEVYVLRSGRRAIGLLELDFRTAGACEIVYFGVVPDMIGTGAGRFFMDAAIVRAWKHPIQRLWLHTCTGDHPGAVAFYRRSGFTPYAFMVEVADDPRLGGHLPRTAAPHIPLLEPR